MNERDFAENYHKLFKEVPNEYIPANITPEVLWIGNNILIPKDGYSLPFTFCEVLEMLGYQNLALEEGALDIVNTNTEAGFACISKKYMLPGTVIGIYAGYIKPYEALFKANLREKQYSIVLAHTETYEYITMKDIANSNYIDASVARNYVSYFLHSISNVSDRADVLMIRKQPNISIKMVDFNYDGINYTLPIALTATLIKPNEYLTLDYGPEYRLEKLIHFDNHNQPIPSELTFIERNDVSNVKEWIKDIQTGDMSICGQLIPNLMRLHENILYFLEKDELEFLYNLITPLPPEAVLVESFEFPDDPEVFLSAIQNKYNHYLLNGYQQYNLDIKNMNFEFAKAACTALSAIKREPLQKYMEGRNKERDLYSFPTKLSNVELKEAKEKAIRYNKIAVSRFRQNDFAQSVEFFQRSLLLYQDIACPEGDTRIVYGDVGSAVNPSVVLAMWNLARAYHQNENYEAALRLYTQCQFICQTEKDWLAEKHQNNFNAYMADCLDKLNSSLSLNVNNAPSYTPGR